MDTEHPTCPECGDVFGSPEELAAHRHTLPLAWERGSTPFACSACGASFDEPGELLDHQAGTHGDGIVAGPEG